MSRIGKRVLNIPENVNVNVLNNVVTVKGNKGELTLPLVREIEVSVEDNTVTVSTVKNTKFANMMQGTTNANIKNMMIGVSEGYKKGLEIVGVGYKFAVSGNKLTVVAGFSHKVEVEVPAGITLKQISNTEIEIEGIDKQLVGEFASEIRNIRKPEPYKGKGIKYKGEQIRTKEGKKASK